MKKWIIRIVLLGTLTGGGYAAYTAFQAMTQQRQMQIATAKVRQGDVIVRSFTRGELRAVRSVTLTAPNLFGTVQVTDLAALGAFAREKDLIVLCTTRSNPQGSPTFQSYVEAKRAARRAAGGGGGGPRGAGGYSDPQPPTRSPK